MKGFCLLILTSLLFNVASACGNEYGHTLDGKKLHTRYFYLTDNMKSFNNQHLSKRIYNLLAKDLTDKKTLSDLAYNLMKLGKIDSAIRILEPLAQAQPTEYNIIANLGTAYELDGQLERALQHISKGIQINPNSHHGSEWIHQAILRAKIHHKNDKRWLAKNTILNEDSLNIRLTRNEISINKLNFQINLQVKTRAPFTPSPNLVISNLLYSLGNINAARGTYENAIIAYAYALEYCNNRNLRTKIRQRVKRLNRKRSNSQIDELPPIFIHLLKRSKIDPSLLTIGLDEFANKQDSLHQEESLLHDSINLLHQQIDSLELYHVHNNTTTSNSKFKSRASSTPLNNTLIYSYIFIGIAIISVINVLCWIVWKKKH